MCRGQERVVEVEREPMLERGAHDTQAGAATAQNARLCVSALHSGSGSAGGRISASIYRIVRVPLCGILRRHGGVVATVGSGRTTT